MNERRHPELELSAEEAKQKLSGKTRRGFLVGGVAAAAGIAAYEWATGAKGENGVPWPERKVLDANGMLARAYVSDAHRMAEFTPDKVGGVKPNGDIGLNTPLDGKAWQMEVSSDASAQPWIARLADVQKLPRVEMTTRFCCIEGWSGISHWAGARFSDFTRMYLGTGTKLPPYVYMATADEEYYVGLDRKSAMHPQTLLAYEQNGKPLEERRGAPLRLVIPVKYGIKNIKRIGQILYTSKKPDDYWAEQGYDWFSGL